MPRVLKIDTLTHRPICKNAGAGGFSGSNLSCHSKARIGLTGQCSRCVIPFFESGVSIDKMVGCGNAVPCGSNLSGTGWEFNLSFGTGSSHAATQSNDGAGTVADEWATVVFSGGFNTSNFRPFTYKWSGGAVEGLTTAGVNTIAPAAAGTYSVTVTDKRGKSKTASMPAVYTKMITVAAMTAHMTNNAGMTTHTGTGSGSNLTITFDTDNATPVAAVFGGKPPFEVRLHALEWIYGDGGTTAQHTAADQKSIKLNEFNTNYAVLSNTVGKTLAHVNGDYKPKLHADNGSFVLTSNQNLTSATCLDGNAPTFGHRWHMSIRDSDGKLIRFRSNAIIAQ